MSVGFPCIRHGDASIADPRLLETVAAAANDGLADAGEKIESLLDYDGQLWVTWRTREAREAGADILSHAWARHDGRGALHLVRSDEDYDYQEDCMNDASASL